MFSYGTEVFNLSTKPLPVFTHLAVCEEVARYPVLYHWAFKSDLSISETLQCSSVCVIAGADYILCL